MLLINNKPYTMGFEIHTAENIAIDLNDLDIEAAAFWNKPVEARSYANPIPLPNLEGLDEKQRRKAEWDYVTMSSANWFDVIGYNIHRPNTNWTSGWNNIKASIWSVHAVDLYSYILDPEKNIKKIEDESTGIFYSEFELRIEGIKSFIKPFYDLIDHWEAKGYIPVQIKE